MGTEKTAKKPRLGKYKRPTTFTIDEEVWDRLKEIEQRTMAKPSTVVNRILSESLNIIPAKEA